jgi:6-phosphofructokinase 1
MGAYAAKLVNERKFGVTVAMDGLKITHNNLSEIAGKTKFVPHEHELVLAARNTGISFGD